MFKQKVSDNFHIFFNQNIDEIFQIDNFSKSYGNSKTVTY